MAEGDEMDRLVSQLQEANEAMLQIQLQQLLLKVEHPAAGALSDALKPPPSQHAAVEFHHHRALDSSAGAANWGGAELSLQLQPCTGGGASCGFSKYSRHIWQHSASYLCVACNGDASGGSSSCPRRRLCRAHAGYGRKSFNRRARRSSDCERGRMKHCAHCTNR